MDERTAAQIVTLLTQAAEALNKSDTATAITLAETLLDDEELPDAAWVSALTVRAKALLNDGLLPDSLEDLDAVLQLVPDDAEALVTRYVDGDLVPQAVISERVRRHPKATFIYALDR